MLFILGTDLETSWIEILPTTETATTTTITVYLPDI